MRPRSGSWLDWTLLTPVFFVLTACAGIGAVATSSGSYAVFGFIPLGLGILFRQVQYKRRMTALGADVIEGSATGERQVPRRVPRLSGQSSRYIPRARKFPS